MDQGTSQPPNDNGNGNSNDDNSERRVFTETFVFTGTNGQSLLATMQNLMNRLIGGQQPQQGDPPQQHQQPQEGSSGRVHSAASQTPMATWPASTASGGDVDGDSNAISSDPLNPAESSGDTVNPPPQQQRTTVENAIDVDDERMPDLEALSEVSSEGSEDQPSPLPRPIRPLPRNGVRPASHPQPHAHFHAHTPHGTIDLITFSVAPGDPIPQPPPHGAPGGPTFTFNLGQDVLAGFEAFFLGMPSFEKEREPDIDRAKVLLRGMETVPEGLVRRLERAGGVPGGHGTEESGSAAGCAVCWGPLLDEVEPGEWETALPAKEKTPDSDTDEKDKEMEEEDDLHGRIVALPCAHVFHAECLLPWFSRQTTCPTCRLDVDPESLTWTPRPPRVPPPQPAQQAGAPGDQLPPTNQGEAPQPNTGGPDPANDPNAAEAARFARFLNSPFLFLPTRPAGPNPDPAGANSNPAGTNSNPAPNPQPAPDTQPAPGAQPVPRHQIDPFVLGLQPHIPPTPIQVPLPSALNNSNPPPWTSNQPPVPWTSSASPWTHYADTFQGDPLSAPAPPTHNFPPPPALPPPMFIVQPDPLLRDPFFPPPPHAHAHPHPHQQFHPHMHTHGHPHTHTQAHAHGPAPRRGRRKWTPPEPVGKTLRQRVEQKERELGLRCDDAVCGVGPTDEEPVPRAGAADVATVSIRAAYDAQGKACVHAFHPACLVMSARVAGVTGEPEGDGEASDVQVACPACRAEGSLHRADWEEGVRASAAEMA